MAKILTVYYSHTGTTKTVAEQISAKVGGSAFELLPVDAYPQDIGEVIKRGQKEIEDGALIALKTEPPKADDYDLIIAGTPNWCSTLAPPLTTYLKSQNLTGKKLAVFVTHGRGGLGHVAEDLKKLFPTASLTEVYDGNEPEKLGDWLKGIGAV
jgi:flavodoxin